MVVYQQPRRAKISTTPQQKLEVSHFDSNFALIQIYFADNGLLNRLRSVGVVCYT